MLTPMFTGIDVWGEDGLDSVDQTNPGEILTIIDDSTWDVNQSYRLNAKLYVHVLSPRGMVGWVHIDNVRVCS